VNRVRSFTGFAIAAVTLTALLTVFHPADLAPGAASAPASGSLPSAGGTALREGLEVLREATRRGELDRRSGEVNDVDCFSGVGAPVLAHL
jgi:hypothetical protein